MALGEFPFSVSTLAFDELQRRTAWRWAETPRVGARPANQFLGPDEDSIRLSGKLVPELIGDAGAIDKLRDLGDQGEAWPLVDGTGLVYGAFVIVSLDERKQHFIEDGVARTSDFVLELRHVDDADAKSEPDAPAEQPS